MISSIIKWAKIIGFAILAIGAGIFLIGLMRNKNKEKTAINEKIQKINSLEAKTEADVAVLHELHKEKEKIETDIQNTNNQYITKIKELMKKPDEPKPGDAARSADGMTDAWK